jgi:ABC-type phosphate transport system substrate-binding protein
MNKIKAIATLVILFSLMAVQFAQAAEVTIIANSSVPESSIDAGTIEKIFLGKKSSWSDGSKIVPVMLASGPTREAFLSNLVKKNDGDFKSFWMQNVFAGKGTPPQTFDSEADLVNFVSSTSGAIGFVAPGTATGSAKTLAVN